MSGSRGPKDAWGFLVSRGWSVRESGCWDYQGPTNWRGYGMVRKERAHRVSYVYHYGEIPTKMLVLHHCDNRVCVNPEHLYVGTAQQNMNDMRDRGRSVQWGHRQDAALCPNGHAYERAFGTAHNRCAECARRRGREFMRRKRSQALKNFQKTRG